MIEVALFYEAAAESLGDDFIDDVQRAINSVRDHPELGVAVAYGFRRILLRRFPFSIIYATEPADIVVVASLTNGVRRSTGKVAHDCSSGSSGPEVSVPGMPVMVSLSM